MRLLFSRLLLCFLLLFFSFVAFSQTCPPATVTISAPSLLYCYNSALSFTATPSNAGANPGYQWKKNGVALSGYTNRSETIMAAIGDVITCDVTGTNTCGNAVTVSSNSLTILSNPGFNQEPEVTIAATQETICTGTQVTFTATNVSQSAAPAYQWLVNGAPAGSNSPTFSTTSLTNGAKVECIMTVPHCNASGGTSGGSTKDYSNAITMTVYPQLNPVISITPIAAALCKGVPLTFTAKAEQAGAQPSYQWKVNGTTVGGNSASFTSTTFNDGDQVSCELMVDPSVAACATRTTAISNKVSLSVEDRFTPTLEITATKEMICEGTPVTFTAVGTDTGPAPTYQWQLNGNNVGTNSTQFTASNLANGDAVSCILKPVSSCGSMATSDVVIMTVNPQPAVSFTPSSVVMEPGQTLHLTPVVQGTIDSHTWSPSNLLVDPDLITPLTAPINSTTTFNLLVQTDAGCEDTASFTVTVYSKLYVPNSFTPNGDGKNDVFRLPPGVPITLKEFSVYDRWGGRVFTTTDKNKSWDGKQKGTDATAGTYVYLIRGEDVKGPVFLKGTVQLIR